MDPCKIGEIAQTLAASRKQFLEDGFVALRQVVSTNFIQKLQTDLERIRSGEYSKNHEPDKIPKETKRRIVLQFVNVWKCSHLFSQLVHSRNLAKIVHDLNDWGSKGVIPAQDQVWWKPPQSAKLSLHRDTPYLNFTPQKVITVWIPLDDMDEKLGPIQYVKGSHKWDTKNGAVSHFFSKSKAFKDDDVQLVSMNDLRIGDLSIHDGNTWHGSSNNITKRPRRGVGIHYIPVEAVFDERALQSKLWGSQCVDEDGNFVAELSEDSFKRMAFE